MPKIEMTEEQVKSLNEVVDYILEHETEDFEENCLDEDFGGSFEEWKEIDKKIISGEMNEPHIYCSAVRLLEFLHDSKLKA